jgi:hypothetical protein
MLAAGIISGIYAVGFVVVLFALNMQAVRDSRRIRGAK